MDCVQHCEPDKIQEHAVEQCLLQALEFGLCGSITLTVGRPGKEVEKSFKSWSGVRRHLQKVLTTLHRGGGDDD